MGDTRLYLNGTRYMRSAPSSVTMQRNTDSLTSRNLDGSIRSSRIYPSLRRDPVQTIVLEWSGSNSCTRCFHDHVQSLLATDTQVWVQCDSWMDYYQSLLTVDPDDDTLYYATHKDIRPFEWTPDSQDTDWANTILVDGSVFDHEDATVDEQAGTVTFTESPGEEVRLSYVYMPMCLVTSVELMPERNEFVDEDNYETHSYKGKVTLTVIEADYTFSVPNPTTSGCLETFNDFEVSDDDVDIPDDGPIIPPYPEPEVIYKQCYPDDSRWQDIRGTFYTTPTMDEIPLGNVVVGAEFYTIDCFIWERNTSGTYSITGVYRLVQSVVADRSYTKSNQFGGVYDTAKQGFVDSSSTKVVMGEFYDSQWPVTFGRATEAQHRGTFYGSIAHITTSTATSFPLAPISTAVGYAMGRYRETGSYDIAEWNTPFEVETLTPDWTNGVYTASLYAIWNEFPDYGFVPAE